MCTETDAQVLTGYWIGPDELVELIELADTGTADLKFYLKQGLSLGWAKVFRGLV